MKKIFAYMIYPVFGILPVAFFVALIINDPKKWVFAPLLYFFLLLVVLGLERTTPWLPEWNESHGDTFLDIQHVIGNLTVSHTAILLYFLAFTFRPYSNLEALTASSLLMQYLVGLITFDFFLYLIHRLSHGYNILWRLHALHHSSERIYTLNGQKRHLLHEILEGLPGLIALWVLGIRPEIAVLIVATVSIHLLFQHANIRYQLGPARYLFAVAELHRWHHQRDWKDVQGNYAAVFSVWDYLFRTNLPQGGDPPARVGLDDDPDLARSSYYKQHLWPFSRKR